MVKRGISVGWSPSLSNVFAQYALHVRVEKQRGNDGGGDGDDDDYGGNDGGDEGDDGDDSDGVVVMMVMMILIHLKCRVPTARTFPTFSIPPASAWPATHRGQRCILSLVSQCH